MEDKWAGNKAVGQAYDNAIYRWNHREHEAPGATYDSILDDEFKALYGPDGESSPLDDRPMPQYVITVRPDLKAAYVLITIGVVAIALSILAAGWGY
jgi:hypothetical protein